MTTTTIKKTCIVTAAASTDMEEDGFYNYAVEEIRSR